MNNVLKFQKGCQFNFFFKKKKKRKKERKKNVRVKEESVEMTG